MRAVSSEVCARKHVLCQPLGMSFTAWPGTLVTRPPSSLPRLPWGVRGPGLQPRNRASEARNGPGVGRGTSIIMTRKSMCGSGFHLLLFTKQWRDVFC